MNTRHAICLNHSHAVCLSCDHLGITRPYSSKGDIPDGVECLHFVVEVLHLFSVCSYNLNFLNEEVLHIGSSL